MITYSKCTLKRRFSNYAEIFLRVQMLKYSGPRWTVFFTNFANKCTLAALRCWRKTRRLHRRMYVCLRFIFLWTAILSKHLNPEFRPQPRCLCELFLFSFMTPAGGVTKQKKIIELLSFYFHLSFQKWGSYRKTEKCWLPNKTELKHVVQILFPSAFSWLKPYIFLVKLPFRSANKVMIA